MTKKTSRNIINFSILSILANQIMLNTTFASNFSNRNPSYSRPNGQNLTYFYDTYQVRVSTAGYYLFTSVSLVDTIGYFYNTTFNPLSPSKNLLYWDDDAGVSDQFAFMYYLQPNIVYMLVVTTFNSSVTGSYTVVVSGSARVTLVRTSNMTSGVITTTIRSNVTTTTGE